MIVQNTFFKTLILVLGLSLLFWNCDDDDGSSTDTVDQLAGTSWIESFHRTSGCMDDIFNEEVRCSTECATIRWESDRFIQTVGSDSLTVIYSKVDGNTIEICLVECAEGDVAIDGDQLTITSGPDEDGCTYYTEYTRL